MYSQINVADKTATLKVYSGWGSGPHVKLIGSTYPIVPAGTVVDKLSMKVPDGLHAVAFFCRVDEPRRMGSGKTAYLDRTPCISSSVLLSWEEDGKLIIKADKDISATELAKFNPFVRSDTDILVTDTDHKVAYVSNTLPHSAVDPVWTYKFVSTDAILEYITKKLTLEELNDKATSEQQAYDELQELRDKAAELDRTRREYNCFAMLLDDLNRYRNGVLRSRWPLCTRNSVRINVDAIIARGPEVKRQSM